MAESGGQEPLQAAELCPCVSVCPRDGAGMGSLLLSPRGEQHNQSQLTPTCPEVPARITEAAQTPSQQSS